MKELEEAIRTKAKILPGDVLKVGFFLNHQVDPDLLRKMAKDVAKHFEGKEITKILTIEASGLPFATAIALELNVPMVFAKKSMTSNVDSAEIAVSKVNSYSHHNTTNIFVPKEYILKEDKVLIADDFLALGEASRGLIDICNQCNATIVGLTIQIEKEFQGGGNDLRNKGYDVYSLASIKSMSLEDIKFN